MDPQIAHIIDISVLSGCVLIVTLTVVGTRAWQRVVALQQNHKKQDSHETVEAVEALRKEVAQLRDTTTRYDMAFDTALQRLESRIAHMESRRSSADEAQVHVDAGRGA